MSDYQLSGTISRPLNGEATVPTLQRFKNGCQWPMWAHEERVPRPPIYCGAPSVSGQSYCAVHCRMAFEPRFSTRGAGEQRLTSQQGHRLTPPAPVAA
jgi:hypothetical protein